MGYPFDSTIVSSLLDDLTTSSEGSTQSARYDVIIQERFTPSYIGSVAFPSASDMFILFILSTFSNGTQYLSQS